jgi:hypothetical protein
VLHSVFAAADNKEIEQKEPVINRALCASIVRYQIPLSVYQESGKSHIDEVFRRLNSGGRHLSKQELRQAGATSKFASIVRKLASNIRGDSSISDILDLNSMKRISITNKNLEYGIYANDIFWVKNNIISREDLRQSKDEEIIADIIAWISLDKGVRSSSDILNQLYNYGANEDSLTTDASLSSQVELQIQKINEAVISENVQAVFDVIIDIVNTSGKNFNSLLFDNQQAKIARYFQIVFLALYELLIEENLVIVNKRKLIDYLDRAGDKIIALAAGGGNWSAKEKQTQINAFCGVIKDCFEKSVVNDPGRNQWITRFENILMQSSTEQTLYDFKAGLHSLHETHHEFNSGAFSKIIKTLTAMANTLPGACGYCILGVSDDKKTAAAHKAKYGAESVKYSVFYVSGIECEADKYHDNVDKYFTKITQLVKSQPISARDIDNISRNISVVNYFNKTVIILKLEAGAIPSVYDGGYYVRHGSNVDEVKAADFSDLFSRFK